MPSALLYTLQNPPDLLRHLAVNLVHDQLGIPEDRVERRAQLVTHVGEELRFMLARNFQLVALLFEFAEQSRILDGDRRLRSKSLENLDDPRRETSGNPPRHRKAAK